MMIAARKYSSRDIDQSNVCTGNMIKWLDTLYEGEKETEAFIARLFFLDKYRAVNMLSIPLLTFSH